jgi:predicted transcriptional regulator
MIAEIKKTKEFLTHFDKEILNSPYKLDYISKKANIPLQTMYRKIKQNKFTLEEVLAILEVIKPEQFQFEMVQEKIKLAEIQIANGQYTTEEDMIFDVETLLSNRK